MWWENTSLLYKELASSFDSTLWTWEKGVCDLGDTDIKNGFLDTVGEGKDGMIWENNIETYILPYVK